MKRFKYSVLLLFLFFTSVLVAQNLNADRLVEEFLGTEKYNKALAGNPGFIEFLKIKSTQGYKVELVPNEKFHAYKELPKILYLNEEISLSEFAKDLESTDFNFLNYSFPTIEEGAFRLNEIDNTIIILYSNKIINRKLRNR